VDSGVRALDLSGELAASSLREDLLRGGFLMVDGFPTAAAGYRVNVFMHRHA